MWYCPWILPLSSILGYFIAWLWWKCTISTQNSIDHKKKEENFLKVPLVLTDYFNKANRINTKIMFILACIGKMYLLYWSYMFRTFIYFILFTGKCLFAWFLYLFWTTRWATKTDLYWRHCYQHSSPILVEVVSYIRFLQQMLPFSNVFLT